MEAKNGSFNRRTYRKSNRLAENGDGLVKSPAKRKHKSFKILSPFIFNDKRQSDGNGCDDGCKHSGGRRGQSGGFTLFTG